MNWRFAKVLAFALMVAVGANALAMQSMGIMAGVRQRPAGCHGRGGQGSSPIPESYQCCQAGHNIAFVRASCLLPLASQAAETQPPLDPQTSTVTIAGGNTTSVFSGPSPGSTPLRI